MAHQHEFKEQTIPIYRCSCGAEGEHCEACGKVFDLDKMKTDSEGYWLCLRCWGSLVNSTPAPSREG